MPGIYGGSGQFGGSPYNNPQMGGLTGWGNQGMTPQAAGAQQGQHDQQYYDHIAAQQAQQYSSQGGFGTQYGGFGGGNNEMDQYGNYNTNHPDYNYASGFAPGESQWVGDAQVTLARTTRITQ
jgi:hypothetical protein